MAVTMRSSVWALVLLGGFAVPASAADISQPVPASAIAISGNVDVTTDYVFRGYSETDGNAALQGEFDATYPINSWLQAYAGIWGSSINFGTAVTPSGQLVDIAPLEIALHGGIRPTWNGCTFDIGELYYSYPNSFSPARLSYNEIKTGVSHSFFNSKLALSLTNYYSSDASGGIGPNDVLEFGYGWTFNKVWNFTPTVSGVVGQQWGDTNDGGIDYAYWNIGLRLAVLDKPVLTLDVRYWDTNKDNCTGQPDFHCGPRVVGTLGASF